MPLLAFDGECLLCHSFIRVLLRLDRKEMFQLTSIDSDYFKERIKKQPVDVTIDSIILFSDTSVYYESTAIIETLRQLPFIGRLAPLGYLIPKGIRDNLYRLIAKHRKKKTLPLVCPLVPLEWRHRIK